MTITKVTLKSPLTVNATGATAITKSALEYKSAETSGSTAPTKVTYQVQSLSPNLGAITKGGGPVTSFTQAELNSNAIFYTADPSNKTILDVTVKLRAIDSTDNSSTAVTLIIRYSLPDMAPEGIVKDVTVGEGKEVKITSANINFTDLFDSANAIFMRIQNWPTHGVMLKSGNPMPMGPNSEFTMQEILDGKISYKHSGDESELDILTFKVRDTKNKWSGVTPGEITNESMANVYVLNINIKLEDLPLLITAEGTLSVVQCESLPITPELLAAADEDDPTLPLTWKLTKLPLHGILKKNNSPMAVGATWTQADITAGSITYTQDCSDTPSDEFLYEVSHSKQTVLEGRFKIKLIPNQKPKVEILALQVPKCNTGVPSQTNIKITDPEGLTPTELKLVVTELPIHGQMRINGATAMIGTEFTYADILAGNVSYIHDCTVHDPLTDTFKFDIIDGGLKVPVVLPIEIIVIKDSPPYMTKNVTHKTERSGEVSFGSDVFDFTDDDTTFDKVFWELTVLPLHGQLFINGLPAVVGRKFSRAQWETIQWRYVAASPANDIVEDFAYFKLSDENNVVENLSIHFTFPPPPVICPDVLNLGLKTAYTLDKALTEFNLFASNTGVPLTEMVWSLDKQPGFGDLNLAGAPLIAGESTWTSKDIMDLKLSYTHKFDTPPTDKFTFNVTNGFCSVSGVFTIEFLPGLKIEINKELVVNQSEPARVIDNTYLLSSSGSVTQANQLLYQLKSKPAAGKLLLSGVELEISTEGTFAFSQAEIDAGLLTYEPDPDQMSMESDFFKFTVSDGIEYIDDVFKIKIILWDRPPELVINELSVGEKQCAEISHSNLKATDRESSANQLVFTILVEPVYGEVKRAGVTLIVGDTFTMDDITKGYVTYCETVDGALLDSFDFSLTDSGNNVLTPNTLPIKIIPPPPPELVNKGMTADPCSERAITGVALNIKNLPSNYDKSTIVFTLKSLPLFGILELNGIAMTIGQTFTLVDIDSNLFTYTSVSYFTKPDSFKFDVASDDLTQLGNTFNIKFRQVNNPPWVCANTGITLFELETKAITMNELQLCDVDLDYDNVLDPNPDSAEDLDVSSTYQVGQVIGPVDADESGRAARTVGIKTPGAPMTLKFTVTSGSARATIRDQNNAILVLTTCQTVADGEKTFTFTPISSSSVIDCQVVQNCVAAPGTSNWTFDIQ